MEVETFFEFADKHGTDSVEFQQGRIREYVFQDGGLSLRYQDFLGNEQWSFTEPSPGTQATLELQRRFHKAKLLPFENAFGQLRSAIDRGVYFQWNAEALGAEVPGDRNCYGEPDSMAMLEHLKALARPHRQELKRIEAKLDALKDKAAEQYAATVEAEAEALYAGQEEQRSAALTIAWDD